MEIKKNILVNKTVDIVCDICGTSCAKEYNIEYGTLHAAWGFDSFHDSKIYHCDMCENCFFTIVEHIKTIGGKVHMKSFVDNYMDGQADGEED